MRQIFYLPHMTHLVQAVFDQVGNDDTWITLVLG